MHADLNQKRTVLNLTEGVLRLREQILSMEDSEEDPDTDEEPIMESLGINMGADGSPVFSWLGMRSKDPEHFNECYLHSGPFHRLMSALKAIGLKFADTHLWWFLDSHRNTDPKKEFYLYPSDPGQTLHETPEMTAPHYIIAARTLSNLQNGDPISAVDVHAFMLQRASEHDHCMVVLMWLHFVEVTNIIRDSESENNANLYRTGARLAMLLFAKTHCTKYVLMGLEMFRWSMVASEADKKMFDECFFTKQTADGKHIWFDRFVEWVNKDIRFYLGKYAKPNQETLMQRTAILLKERIGRRATDRSRSHHKQNHYDRPEVLQKDIAVSPIFCQQYVLIDRHNYWGEGSVHVGKHELKEAQYFSDPTGSVCLNTEILFDISAAEYALQSVFSSCFLGDNEDRKQYSAMDYELKQTPTTLDDITKTKKQELTKYTSTKGSDIEAVTTKIFCKQRAKYLVEEEYPHLPFGPIPVNKDEPTKKTWASYLGHCHRIIIQHDSNFRPSTKRRLEGEAATNFADREAKQNELRKPFYTFTDNAKAAFESRKYSVDNQGHEEQQQQTPNRTSDADIDVTPAIRPFRRMSLG
jgi:hypothetical protein